MTAVSLDDLKQDVSGILQRVAAGESFLIVEGDYSLAELRPATSPPCQRRPYGLCAGEFTVPMDFDQPLPESLLQEFEGQ